MIKEMFRFMQEFIHSEYFWPMMIMAVIGFICGRFSKNFDNNLDKFYEIEREKTVKGYRQNE